MTKIHVVDLIMGGGKSTYCFDIMDRSNNKHIYITPYLDEIKRLIGDNSNRTHFYTQHGFREPLHLGEGKLEGLHELLIKNSNIATTHSLFKMSTTETIDLIASGDYTLMLDESLDVVDMFDISIQDYEMLMNNKLIEVNDKGFVKWINDEYEGKFYSLKNLCKNGSVVQVKKTTKVQFLAWNFSSDSFNAFKEVYIFTYLFEGSLMKCYFDMHNVEYDKLTIQDKKLIQYENKNPYDKNILRKLINVYDGNLNLIGEKEYALSLNWFKNYPDLKTKLKNNVYNYFRNVTKAKSSTIIWTTFKSAKSSLSGSGYSRRFIACNIRATNEYKDCYNLAYCCNRYISPDYINYFQTHSVNVDENLFALSELLQWIWRSAIREGKSINIYIPSQRMRNILINWLNNENI